MFTDIVTRLLRDQKGATALEYAFLVALIALGLIGVLSTIGGQLLSYFTQVNSGFVF